MSGEQTGMPWAPQPKDPVDELPDNPVWRSKMQDRRIDKGLHPLYATPIPKAADGFTSLARCRDCTNAVQRGAGGGFGKGWWKCALREDSTPRTDLRPSWPACDRFERKPT